MKSYRNGKMIEVSEEKAEKVKRHMSKHMKNLNSSQQDKTSSEDYEARIKALEDSMVAILAKLGMAKKEDKKEEPEKTV